MREHLEDGTDLANQARDQEQEQEGKEVLARLDKLAPEDEEFQALPTQFTSAALAHIAFKETTVWPSLQSVLTGEEAAILGH